MISLGKLGLLFLLLGRMFYMQFIKKDEYKTLSDKNRIKTLLLLPTRGEIKDRNGVLLAKNNTCFNLLLDKNSNPKFLDEVKILIDILELDEKQALEITKRVKSSSRKVAAIIIDGLKWSELAAIQEKNSEFNAIFIDTGLQRNYPFPYETAHLLGYLSRPSEKDSGAEIKDNLFKIGKHGVEKSYEEILQGECGVKRIEVNATGRYIRMIDTIESKPGGSITLNISSELQNRVMSILSPQGASAVLMDCRNGRVLACASTPSFDPNQFHKLSNTYWQELIKDPYKPLINKVTRSLYPPGSVFKIVTILAALEHGLEPSYQVHCSGQLMLGGNSFRCAKISGHGTLNMHHALQYSCNSYMYSIAKHIGADRILETARKLGFSSVTGIDLPNEVAGFLPTRQWKKEKHKYAWSLGDSFNLAIGQGFTLCTPIQLTRMIAAIASDGKLFVPKILQCEPEYVQIAIDSQHLEILRKALFSAVNEPGGTGYSSRLDNPLCTMSGKTGTAQVVAKKSSKDDLNRETVAWQRRNHAIFSGYAPSDNPRFAVSVYFDHAGAGGKAAAPIAKKIIQDALELGL